MPNRILKESICYSESIKKLSADQEAFFYRLIVNCDDYGRFDTRLLRGRLYPIDDNITNEIIEQRLQAIVREGMAILYEHKGIRYIALTNWEKHQQQRAKKSKYPDPFGSGSIILANYSEYNNLQANDINGDQMIANVPVIQSNPIRNPDPNPIRNPIRSTDGEQIVDNCSRNIDKIEERFRELTGRMIPSPRDIQGMQKALQLAKGRTEIVIASMDETVKNYKPPFPEAKIRTFSYFLPALQEKVALLEAKGNSHSEPPEMTQEEKQQSDQLTKEILEAIPEELLNELGIGGVNVE